MLKNIKIECKEFFFRLRKRTLRYRILEVRSIKLNNFQLYSELKRRLKAEQKEKEKAEKAAAKPAPAPGSKKVEVEEEIDANVNKLKFF